LDERKQKDETSAKKTQEDAERLKVVLVKKEDDLENIVTVRKIRDIFRDQSAERHLKQVQAKRERWDTDGKERGSGPIVRTVGPRSCREEARSSDRSYFKQEAIIRQLRDLIGRGGKLDIE
jgi:hypothetical protein